MSTERLKILSDKIKKIVGYVCSEFADVDDENVEPYYLTSDCVDCLFSMEENVCIEMLNAISQDISLDMSKDISDMPKMFYGIFMDGNNLISNLIRENRINIALCILKNNLISAVNITDEAYEIIQHNNLLVEEFKVFFPND